MNEPTMRVASIDYDVDATKRTEFRAALDPLRSAPIAIIDFSRTNYIDSTAVTELLFFYRERAAGNVFEARLVVGEPNKTVARIVDMAGLREVFGVFETLEAASHGG